MVALKELRSTAPYLGEDHWWVVSLRGLYWDQYYSTFLLGHGQWDWVHPQQVCGWHQAEWCGCWHFDIFSCLYKEMQPQNHPDYLSSIMSRLAVLSVILQTSEAGDIKGTPCCRCHCPERYYPHHWDTVKLEPACIVTFHCVHFEHILCRRFVLCLLSQPALCFHGSGNKVLRPSCILLENAWNWMFP